MKGIFLFVLLLTVLVYSCKKRDCSDSSGEVTYPYSKVYSGHFTYWARFFDNSWMIKADTIVGSLDTISTVTFLSADSCTVNWPMGAVVYQAGKPVFTPANPDIISARYTAAGFKQHSENGHYAWEAQLRGDSLLEITTDTTIGIDSYFRHYSTFSGKSR